MRGNGGGRVCGFLTSTIFFCINHRNIFLSLWKQRKRKRGKIDVKFFFEMKNKKKQSDESDKTELLVS